MESFAKQLSQITNPTPIFEDKDPEEDTNIETTARLVDKFDKEYEDTSRQDSKLRKKTAPLLQDKDARYAGKKISRRDLNLDVDVANSPSEKNTVSSDDDETEEEEDDDDDVEEEEEDDGSGDEDTILDFKRKLEEKRRQQSEINEYSEEGMSEDEEGEEDEDEEEGEDDGSNSGDNQEAAEKEDLAQMDTQSDDDVIQKFSKIDVEDEIEKGKCVKAQLGVCDNLLECRIKLQKALSTSNRLPQHDTFSYFKEKGGKEYSSAINGATKSTEKLLNLLLKLQEDMLKRNHETKHILDNEKSTSVSEKSTSNISASDEEIPSDTEEEVDESVSENVKELLGKKRKFKFHDYTEVLAKRHSNFCPYRNAVIQKWNEKTRLASGKISKKSFSAFEQSALKQIEQILTDKSRLITRTQLKRTAYRVLGKLEAKEEKTDSNAEMTGSILHSQNDHLKDYDCEIFDDDDFYHQLLRELIERKTADVHDPIVLSRKWLEIQKLRSKMKKKVDTKASKGRKIRFDVHPKLVNFMAPVTFCSFTDEARNELFSSLFGKRSRSS